MLWFKCYFLTAPFFMHMYYNFASSVGSYNPSVRIMWFTIFHPHLGPQIGPQYKQHWLQLLWIGNFSARKVHGDETLTSYKRKQLELKILNHVTGHAN